jgi:hypothetical protein
VGLYRSESLKQQIEQRLAQHKWIFSVSINTLTGSVLVQFDAQNGDHASAITSLLKAAVERTSGDPIEGKEYPAPASPQGTGTVLAVPARPVASPPRTPAGKEVQSVRSVRKEVANAEDQPEDAWH